jgi:hypothetical protein
MKSTNGNNGKLFPLFRRYSCERLIQTVSSEQTFHGETHFPVHTIWPTLNSAFKPFINFICSKLSFCECKCTYWKILYSPFSLYTGTGVGRKTIFKIFQFILYLINICRYVWIANNGLRFTSEISFRVSSLQEVSFSSMFFVLQLITFWTQSRKIPLLSSTSISWTSKFPPFPKGHIQTYNVCCGKHYILQT